LSYTTYFNAVSNTNTEFENLFPKPIVSKIRKGFLCKSKGFTMKEVVDICKEYNLTYAKFQQLESLYLSKLQFLTKER
jgi:hypothetical protein